MLVVVKGLFTVLTTYRLVHSTQYCLFKICSQMSSVIRLNRLLQLSLLERRPGFMEAINPAFSFCKPQPVQSWRFQRPAWALSEGVFRDIPSSKPNHSWQAIYKVISNSLAASPLPSQGGGVRIWLQSLFDSHRVVHRSRCTRFFRPHPLTNSSTHTSC